MLKVISKDKFIIILFFIAVLSGLFWGSKILGRPLIEGGNENFYNDIANNILEHSSFVSDKNDIAAASEPFYSIFLAGIYIFSGKDNFDAVRIIQILLFALTVLMVYSLAKKITNTKAAKITGLIAALFFPLAVGASQFSREALFAYLLVLLLYSLYRTQESLKTGWFIFSGIILGLAVLTNAIVQFFIVFIIMGFLLIFGKDFFQKNILIKTGTLTLIFILIIGIWSFRDFKQGPKALNLKAGSVLSRKAEMMENIRGEIYLRHLGGQFLGYYFFEKDGFNPSMLLGMPKTSKIYYEMWKNGENLEQISKKLSEENLRVVIKNPFWYLAISFLDFLQFNGLMLPNPETLEASPGQNLFIKNSHSGAPPILKIIILLGLRVVYWVFFGFIIYSLARAVKDWRKLGWIVLVVLYFNFVYSATFGIPRYSVPIYPFYIMLFVYGVSAFLGGLNLEKISKNINFNVA